MIKLIPPETIQIESEVLHRIDTQAKSIYRAITFCKKTSSKSLLDSFVNSTNSLTALLSIKNAQMEAETHEEIAIYHKNLNKAIIYIVNEIKNERNFEKQVQLFQIFRLVSPEAHQRHPNQYRQTLVQIGKYVCPNANEVTALIEGLFSNLRYFSHPLLKAIYLHHELIRIHPFVDGNGRTIRLAKNWLLMFNLYPPIFIKNDLEKKEYVGSLSNSFMTLQQNGSLWNGETEQFFKLELQRVSYSIQFILDEIKKQSRETTAGN